MKTIEEIFGVSKVVASVTCTDFDLSVKTCQAIKDGGLNSISFNMFSQRDFVTLEKLIKVFPTMELGASRIIDAAGFLSASLSGARFIASVGMNSELYSGISTRYNDAHFLPGVITPSQVMESISRGFKVMNLFPAELFNGKALLDQFNQTFPLAKFIANGNLITIENMDEYLIKPNVVGVLLSEIASSDLIAVQNFSEITKRSKLALAKSKMVLKI